MHDEPARTALALVVAAVLVAISAVFSRASGRLGVPIVLFVLAVGIASGPEMLAIVTFENFEATVRIGTIALALILFDGGLNTKTAALRRVARPAGLLASVGVVLTGTVIAACAHLLGFDWHEALLLGAVVSSTDAAAVFSVLRGSGLSLKRRVATTLEVESGLNDPVAVILTSAAAQVFASPEEATLELVLGIPLQIVIGAAGGLLIGLLARRILTTLRLPAGGLYPVLTVAVAFFAFGAPSLVSGSGFLAVYIAGVVIGNTPLPYRAGILRVHDSIAWLSQITMFLLLGLLALPSRLVEVAGVGLVLGLLLTALARPVAVLPCLLPFGYTLRELAFIAWAGLRGAVPIILASYAVLGGADPEQRVLDVVFFIVVVNNIVPGVTMRWLTRKLRLASNEPPSPPAVLEFNSTMKLRGEIMSFHIGAASAVAGQTIADLPFPEGASVMLLIRGNDLLPPHGETVLTVGDHVYVLGAPEDVRLIELMFGGREDD